MDAISLRPLLAGGDRRSIARAKDVLALVRGHPDLIEQLVGLTGDPDWLVVMRALDVLEKLAQEQPHQVEPHRSIWIGALADATQWEIRLQIVRALPLFAWTATERRRVAAILVRDAEHPQAFVRAWAVDSLVRIADVDPALQAAAERALAGLETSARPALRTRARQIRRRLATHGGGRPSRGPDGRA